MDDDEVARLLTKEARDSSNKYLTEGLGAYRSSRPAGNAPKPNTRFLRHLIKETDNHNTALKRKEEREARERMRALKPGSATPQVQKSHSRRSDRPSARDPEKRDRRDRDRHDRDRHDRDDKSRTRRRRTRSPSPSLDDDKSRRYRHRDERDRHRRRDDRRSHGERERDTRPHSSSRKDRRDRHRSYSRSPSRSPRRDRSSKPRSSQSTRDSTHRSRRDQTSTRPHRRSPEHSRQSTPTSTSTTTFREDNCTPADESDPLEDFVGPLPPTTSSAPILPRGRGAYKAQASNIDAHFAADYNPSLDVQPDEDEATTKQSSRRHVPGLMTGEDDWDMALEALRDRTKWRQKGEDRLRAAGINEGAIDRWKNSATSTGTDTERRPEDVQWSKKGEGREWDRGKFVDDEGHIDVRAGWSK